MARTKKPITTPTPEDDFKRRVSRYNDTVLAVQESFEDDVLDAWKVSGDEGVVNPADQVIYRETMRQLKVLERELRTEKERLYPTMIITIKDAITRTPKMAFNWSLSVGRINRLRPGVVKDRQNADTIAKTSHDASQGFSERLQIPQRGE